MLQVTLDDCGDQKTRDYKENIDADKAAADADNQVKVECEDKENGDSAQPVNVTPISELHG